MLHEARTRKQVCRLGGQIQMGEGSDNRLAHPNENLGHFSVGGHRFPQAPMLFECEEKSGEVATPCCAHPITSLGKDTEPRIGFCAKSRSSNTQSDGLRFSDIQFSERFDI